MSKKMGKKTRRISRYELERTASRLRTNADGEQVVMRFGRAQQVEHYLLILSFTMLAVTGLPQRYASSAIGTLILRIFGGIDATRQIHHIFAVMFALETVAHLILFLYNGFRSGNWGAMWPGLDDLKHAWEMILYNLDKRDKHPYMGRFTFDEKVEYWALIWGTAVMGITGLMQWFPIQVTKYLPGSAIPVARMFHSWEAVLAVLAIMIWHTYHVVIKTINRSIFTGTLTIEEMEEEHPAELAYILWAVETLKKKEHEEVDTTPKKSKQLSPVLSDVATTGDD